MLSLLLATDSTGLVVLVPASRTKLGLSTGARELLAHFAHSNFAPTALRFARQEAWWACGELPVAKGTGAFPCCYALAAEAAREFLRRVAARAPQGRAINASAARYKTLLRSREGAFVAEQTRVA